jgi:hypothetical protein
MQICFTNTFQKASSLCSCLKIESGGMLIVESKGTINTDISKSNFTHNLIDVSYGSNVRFVIVP